MPDDLLTRARSEEIFDQVKSAARALGVSEVEVMLGARASALTRFANNIIHQNVAAREHYFSVRPVIGRRTARATGNRLDAASIRAVVEQAVALTRSSEADPDLLPLPVPETITDVNRFSDATAETTPDDRARGVKDAIDLVESAGQIAAGIYSTSASFDALLNSRGLFAAHAETMAQFSITAMARDSSGWAKATSTDSRDIDPVLLATRARDKARLSADPREMPPGRYTVILEPAAVLDLVGQMFSDFSATSIADERSFLTGRLDQKLFGSNITIHDDVHHPLQAGVPYDGEGVARKRLTLVDEGQPRDIAYCRLAADRAGKAPTGHGFPLPNEYGEAPSNIVISGGPVSVDEMIASTGRGILVTRLWYIREVDPYEKIMTGMTRDGTFLIENGAIVGGVRNFRFNESLLELLQNVEALSPIERASGEESFDMVVPAMKVRDFQFTEVTRF